MKKYNVETLKEINQSYDYEHNVTTSDVEMVNKYVEAIEKSRDNNSPQIGDIVRYTNKYGNYYHNAHVEEVTDNEIYICESPYTPFINFSYDNKGIHTSTSGGAWNHIPKTLTLVGTEEKAFSDFGHCGGCGNGAVTFYAKVNVWEYSENTSPYSTKDYDKFSVRVDNDTLNASDYKYFISKSYTSYKAFRTDEEYNNWLNSVKGIEIKESSDEYFTVWTYKLKTIYAVKEDVFNSINGILGEELSNGSMRTIKRVVDDINKTITTYFLEY